MLFITSQTIEQGPSFKAGRPDIELKNNPTSLAVWRCLREDAHAFISRGSHYGAPYLALLTSRMIGLEDKAAPENTGKIDRAVCALDCDDLNAVYDPIKGRSYFLYRENGRKNRGSVSAYVTDRAEQSCRRPAPHALSACNDELNRRADHGERLR